MKTKEEIYLDLSKLSVEEIKEVLELIIETDDIIEETLKDLNRGRYTDGFRYLFRSPSGWNQNDYRLENRTEIDLSEFRQLFSKEEEVLKVENNGWIKIESEKDLPKNDGEYLVFYDDRDVIYVSYFDLKDWGYLATIKENPTHWMPLPEPPKF